MRVRFAGVDLAVPVGVLHDVGNTVPIAVGRRVRGEAGRDLKRGVGHTGVRFRVRAGVVRGVLLVRIDDTGGARGLATTAALERDSQERREDACGAASQRCRDGTHALPVSEGPVPRQIRHSVYAN